jgi:hypothetical protein
LVVTLLNPYLIVQGRSSPYVQGVADIARLMPTAPGKQQEHHVKKLMIIAALVTGIAVPALAATSSAFAGPRDNVYNYDRAVNGSDASTPGHN